MKTLVLGGVKSGKSRFAEQLVHDWVDRPGNAGAGVIYLATAESRNDEFSRRIERHRADRPQSWRTIEAPLEVTGVISAYGGTDSCILVECLTLWMSNLLAQESDLSDQVDAFIEAVESSRAEIILVSNETGLGIMPVNDLARRFGDEIGLLHQRLAEISDRVVLTVAGLPHELKKRVEPPA